jgi:putative ABC transport system permease protein
MTLLVTVAATLLALAPAILLGRVAVENLLGFLGIQPASLAAPWWTYLTVLAAGLGLPPLTALAPLVKTSRTTVRAASDHHGVGSTPSAATGVLARRAGHRGAAVLVVRLHVPAGWPDEGGISGQRLSGGRGMHR